MTHIARSPHDDRVESVRPATIVVLLGVAGLVVRVVLLVVAHV